MSHRLAVLLAGAAVVALSAVLALPAGSGRATPGSTPTPAAAAATSTPPDPGRQVFLRDCAWCHGTDASGTHNGPSLVGVGQAAVDFYLRTGRMPLSSPDATVKRGRPAYDSTTIEALVRYLGGLASGPAIPPLRPGDAAEGRTLFLENCAACHSASGTGTIVTGGQQAPSLWPTAPQQVAEAIRIGPGAMPPFSSTELSDQDVDNIVSYVSQLGSRQRIGGAGLDQYGPIIEGAVALFVLVPALLIVSRLLGKRAPARKEQQ
jgi:ubiquinol-cytochrome c reductase cytochrome c subunit